MAANTVQRTPPATADALNERLPASDPAGAVRRAETLAHWLDNRFRIPGTNQRIGIDGILGLIPGVGDTVSAVLSSYIVGEAWRHDLPKRVLLRMGWNIVVDTAIGAVPLVGDLFDFAWKANHKNATLLAEHMGKKTQRSAS